MTVMATVAGCVLICGFTVWRCVSLVSEERQQIYILDGDIPFLAERAKLESNFIMEAKAHIQLFHHIFSTCLPTTTISSGLSERPCIWPTARP